MGQQKVHTHTHKYIRDFGVLWEDSVTHPAKRERTPFVTFYMYIFVKHEYVRAVVCYVVRAFSHPPQQQQQQHISRMHIANHHKTAVWTLRCVYGGYQHTAHARIFTYLNDVTHKLCTYISISFSRITCVHISDIQICFARPQIASCCYIFWNSKCCLCVCLVIETDEKRYTLMDIYLIILCDCYRTQISWPK